MKRILNGVGVVLATVLLMVIGLFLSRVIWFQTHHCLMKTDMSPEAITRRWRKVAELVRVCRALRIKPGSVRPVEGASDNVPPIAKPDPFADQAGDQGEDQSPGQRQQSG